MSNRYEDRPYFETELYKCKQNGNRVLNENLDKIKFPFGCTYQKLDEYGKPIKGLQGKGIVHKDGEDWFVLFNIDKQGKFNYVDQCKDLANLIKGYHINILKMKILLFQK